MIRFAALVLVLGLVTLPGPVFAQEGQPIAPADPGQPIAPPSAEPNEATPNAATPNEATPSAEDGATEARANEPSAPVAAPSNANAASEASAGTAEGSAPEPAEPVGEANAEDAPDDGEVAQAVAEGDEEDDADELPEASRPRLSLEGPRAEVFTGDVAVVTLRVDAARADDISIPADQDFAPFEVLDRNVQLADPPPSNAGGRRVHTFTLELLALEPGEQTFGPVRVRVLTPEGVIGEVETETLTINVGSVLGNEPNAEPQPPTDPVELLEEDPTLYWLGGGLLVILLTALITWFFARWWRRRERAAAPPPPPRPAHEIALEKLGELKRRRARMLENGEGEPFVDGVSDAVREYLGHRYGFEGLESTTDEVLQHLDMLKTNAPRESIASLLMDCDLVKFARADFTEEQSELLLSGAFHIVRHTMVSAPIPNAAPASAETRPAPNAAPAADARWMPPSVSEEPPQGAAEPSPGPDASPLAQPPAPAMSAPRPATESHAAAPADTTLRDLPAPSELQADAPTDLPASASSTPTRSAPLPSAPTPGQDSPIAHADDRPSGYGPMRLPSEPPRAIPNTNPPPAFGPVAEPSLAAERTIPDTLPPPAPVPKRDFVDTLQGDAFADRLQASREAAGRARENDGDPESEGAS
ncbi:MAG: hypothetical protein AAF645_11725 [Myxococcota bacterium]